MKFFEKNMKYFVMAIVVVVGYYVWQDMKAKKEAKEMEEAVKQIPLPVENAELG